MIKSLSMKPFLSVVVFLISFSVFNPVYAVNTQKIVDKVNPNLNYGLKIYDLTANKTLYSHHAAHLFVPASNDKLYTAAAALVFLGHDFRFKTRVFTNANTIQQGVLTGNLYIQFEGDPSLNSQDLVKLFQKLRMLGIQRIQGKIILDTNAYSAEPYGPGWMVDDVSMGYGAKVSALILNENAINVWINPNSQIGQKAWVQLGSADTRIQLNNELITDNHIQYCKTQFAMNQQNLLTVKGCIKPISLGYEQSVAITNLQKYAVTQIEYALKEANIAYKPDFLQAGVPNHATLLATHLSKPLSFLIQHMLKVSDNLYAESIFLKIGAVYYKKPANWHLAQKAVRQILKHRLHIHLSRTSLKDGSGLSRYNLTSPDKMLALLKAMYHYYPDNYDFMASLPENGVDGTLADRMSRKNMLARVRAKTGSMTGVSTLSGYLTKANGHVIAFSMMMNNFDGSIQTYRNLQDKLLNHFFKAGVSHINVSMQNNLNAMKHQKALNKFELEVRKMISGSSLQLIQRNSQPMIWYDHMKKSDAKLLKKIQKTFEKNHIVFLQSTAQL